MSSISWNSRAFWIARHRLRGESLDQVHGVLRERAGRAAAHHQHPDDLLTPRERRQQQRTETGAQDDVVQSRRGPLAQIGYLDRLTLRKHCRDVRLVKPDLLVLECVNQLLIHAVSGAQVKFALRRVVHVDRAGVGVG